MLLTDEKDESERVSHPKQKLNHLFSKANTQILTRDAHAYYHGVSGLCSKD